MRSSALRTTLAGPIALSLALAACDRDSTGPDSAAPSLSRASAESEAGGAVYTSTNGASANAILAFRRAEDGALTPIGSFPTGGRGTGGAVDPLASQYAVILSADHHLLFTVNAGSNDITSYRVGDDGGLVLADRRSAGGTLPVSLAGRGGLLYVLNAGDNTVTGLRVNAEGKLIAIPQGSRALASGASGASTIHFSADGRSLIVTERTANRLETLAVEASGRLDVPVVTASSGAVPFGFDVYGGRRGGSERGRGHRGDGAQQRGLVLRQCRQRHAVAGDRLDRRRRQGGLLGGRHHGRDGVRRQLGQQCDCERAGER